MKEIIPGLILGGLRDLNDILKAKPDVLFPLDRLPGTVWDNGFRGEIVYYPITDMDVLPDDVLMCWTSWWMRSSPGFRPKSALPSSASAGMDGRVTRLPVCCTGWGTTIPSPF